MIKAPILASTKNDTFKQQGWHVAHTVLGPNMRLVLVIRTFSAAFLSLYPGLEPFAENPRLVP